MRDSEIFQGGAILLVQWLRPTPVGTPYAEANHAGWYREHANASQSGQQARYDAAVAAGGRPYGPPSAIAITDAETIYSFGFRDPDGTTLEWVGPVAPTPTGAPDTLGGPNVDCRNLPRSYAFYNGVLGLEMQVRLNPSHPQPASNGSLGDAIRRPNGALYTGVVDFDAAIMVPRVDDRNSIDLLQWQIPGTFGAPYDSANHLGVVNMTWEVNSIQVVYEKLLQLLPDPPLHRGAAGDVGSRRLRKAQGAQHPRPRRGDDPVPGGASVHRSHAVAVRAGRPRSYGRPARAPARRRPPRGRCHRTHR